MTLPNTLSKITMPLLSDKKQASHSPGLCAGQASKLRPSKSRLSRNARFAEGSEKAAVANALGLSSNDKISSLGGKLDLSLGGKGSLATKLPMMGSLSSTGGRAGQRSARSEGRSSRPPQARLLYPPYIAQHTTGVTAEADAQQLCSFLACTVY